MLAYAARRILYAIPIALAVSLFCFSLVHIAPGDPLSAILPPESTPALIEQLKRDFGLDRPLYEQFVRWLGQAAQGNLGVSIATGRPVAAELRSALANTAVLACAAALIAFPLGLLLGALAGYRHGRPVDRVTTAASLVGVSIPHYWLGIILVILFSVKLNWLPSMGMGTGRAALSHLVLPAITMAVVPLAIVTRTVRAAVSEVLEREFVVALRAKGLSERKVFAHVMRNVASTSLAVMGLQFGYLLGGSVLIETVFSWPGAGLLLGNAILQRDLPILQGTILALAMFFVVLNLVVDILQTVIDPRIRRTA